MLNWNMMRDNDRSPRNRTRTVALDEDRSGHVFDLLSRSTTRRVLAALYEEAASPEDLTDTLDESIPTVEHHIGKLRSADLVRPVPGQSPVESSAERIYEPCDRSLVLGAGLSPRTKGLRTAVARILAVVLVLAGVASTGLYLAASPVELPAFAGDPRFLLLLGGVVSLWAWTGACLLIRWVQNEVS